jgi:hypothetical protein
VSTAPTVKSAVARIVGAGLQLVERDAGQPVARRDVDIAVGIGKGLLGDGKVSDDWNVASTRL